MDEHRKGTAAAEYDLDVVIAELDAPCSGKLPERAIREAQRQHERITPLLIDLLKEATDLVRDGESPGVSATPS